LKAKPAAAHAAAQMADMAAGTYTSAEEAIHKAASAAQKGAQACKKAVTPSARAYQKAEHSAKQATRAALAAHSAAGKCSQQAFFIESSCAGVRNQSDFPAYIALFNFDWFWSDLIPQHGLISCLSMVSCL